MFDPDDFDDFVLDPDTADLLRRLAPWLLLLLLLMLLPY